ncbi:MAG: hypothetical protein AAFS12_10190 [Cyanobacteria bacterium J06632_19]
MTKQVAPFSVGFDCGNGAVKLKVSGHGNDFEYIRFPSYYFDVSTCTGDHQGKSKVTYLEAPENNKVAKGYVGKTFVTGDDATVFDVRNQVFDNRSDGKVQLALPLFLSAIAQLPITRKHWEFRVVASIHDAEIYGDKLAGSLAGRHIVEIAGQKTTIVIHIVKIYDEGYIFKPSSKGNTTILDIGNGTSIITRFDSEGNVIFRPAPYRFGVQHLYKKINEHPDLRAIGLDRDIELIRRGVETSTVGKIFYGFGNGAKNITKAYKESLKDWSSLYLKETIATVDKFQMEGDKIVLVGGGACLPLLDKNFQKKGYVFKSNAPFMNVKKLHEAACNALTTEVMEVA